MFSTPGMSPWDARELDSPQTLPEGGPGNDLLSRSPTRSRGCTSGPAPRVAHPALRVLNAGRNASDRRTRSSTTPVRVHLRGSSRQTGALFDQNSSFAGENTVLKRHFAV